MSVNSQTVSNVFADPNVCRHDLYTANRSEKSELVFSPKINKKNSKKDKIQKLTKIHGKINSVAGSLHQKKQNVDQASKDANDSIFVNGTGSSTLNSSTKYGGPAGLLITLITLVVTEWDVLNPNQKAGLFVSIAFTVFTVVSNEIFKYKQDEKNNVVTNTQKTSDQMAYDLRTLHTLNIVVSGALAFLQEKDPAESYQKLVDLRCLLIDSNSEDVPNRYPYLVGKIEGILNRGKEKGEIDQKDLVWLDNFINTKFIPPLKLQIQEFENRVNPPVKSASAKQPGPQIVINND